MNPSRRLDRRWITLIWVLPLWGLAQGAAPVCKEGDASQALQRLGCGQPEQLEEILSYENPVLEKTLRRALAGAAELTDCVNRAADPLQIENRQDLQCLRQKLLTFYDQVAVAAQRPGELHFRDLLSRASLRIRFCMQDENFPVSRCLELFESALRDYRFVFESARDMQTDPRDPANLELAAAMGVNLEAPQPEAARFEEFLELALENSRRLPRLLGEPIGKALGPTLCAGFELYPSHRAEIAELYNLLIRFDGGNMASSRQLYEFMRRLKEFFRPAASVPSYLQLTPADWSGSPPPCGKPDWELRFPEFSLRPGYWPPGRQQMEAALSELQALLNQTAELVQLRNHVWKPFLRYGELLAGLAASLKPAGVRSREAWEMRRLLMERARDSLLMRGLEPSKRPFDLKELQALVDGPLENYITELLLDARFQDLISFVQESLNAGEALLTESQRRRLHGRLATAYFLLDDEPSALEQLKASDLRLADLEEIRKAFRDWGVGSKILKGKMD